jgi:hypothetical protein
MIVGCSAVVVDSSQTSAARAGFITRAGRSRPDATPEGPQRQPLGQASSPARRSSGSPKRQLLGQASSLCDVARTHEADVVPKRQPLGQASSHRSNRSVGCSHRCPQRQPLGQASSPRGGVSPDSLATTQTGFVPKTLQRRVGDCDDVPNVSRLGRIHHGKYLWGDLRIPNVSRSDRIHHA